MFFLCFICYSLKHPLLQYTAAPRPCVTRIPLPPRRCCSPRRRPSLPRPPWPWHRRSRSASPTSTRRPRWPACRRHRPPRRHCALRAGPKRTLRPVRRSGIRGQRPGTRPPAHSDSLGSPRSSPVALILMGILTTGSRRPAGPRKKDIHRMQHRQHRHLEQMGTRSARRRWGILLERRSPDILLDWSPLKDTRPVRCR